MLVVARRNSANFPKLNVLGSEVRRFRFEADLTQEELAVRLQVRGWLVTQDVIARFENGQRTMTDRELLRFLSILGKELSDIRVPEENIWDEIPPDPPVSEMSRNG